MVPPPPSFPSTRGPLFGESSRGIGASDPALSGSQPYIKSEVNNERPQLDAPLANGDDFDDDDENFMEEDEEGHRYYSDAGFRIRQVVEATVVQRSLIDLYNLSQTKYLKLDPEYQRDVVWDETRSSGLIASILQGYFIPPIIFNVISQAEKRPDGSKMVRHYRICVDGKQRLSSVQKFVEGRIGVVDSSHPPKKWFYDHPLVDGVRKESNHHILPESTKEFFRLRAFCCYEYSDLPEQIEENMFQLVQRGMPLTIAEKLRAMSTKWASFTKQYEADYDKVVNLVKQSRASGFRSVITIFCQIMEVMSPSGKGKQRDGIGHKPVLQSAPATLSRLLQDDKSLDEATKSKLKQVFDKYLHLVELSSEPSNLTRSGTKVKANSAFATNPDYLREEKVAHVKTFSPLELLATACLISVHMEDRTDAMLLGDIKEMRHYLREKHKDLRINQLCWATAWFYIDTLMIQRRGGAGAVRQRDKKSQAVVVISDEEDREEEEEGDGGDRSDGDEGDRLDGDKDDDDADGDGNNRAHGHNQNNRHTRNNGHLRKNGNNRRSGDDHDDQSSREDQEEGDNEDERSADSTQASPYFVPRIFNSNHGMAVRSRSDSPLQVPQTQSQPADSKKRGQALRDSQSPNVRKRLKPNASRGQT